MTPTASDVSIVDPLIDAMHQRVGNFLSRLYKAMEHNVVNMGYHDASADAWILAGNHYTPPFFVDEPDKFWGASWAERSPVAYRIGDWTIVGESHGNVTVEVPVKYWLSELSYAAYRTDTLTLVPDNGTYKVGAQATRTSEPF